MHSDSPPRAKKRRSDSSSDKEKEEADEGEIPDWKKDRSYSPEAKDGVKQRNWRPAPSSRER